MTKYIDKDALVAEIAKKKKSTGNVDRNLMLYRMAIQSTGEVDLEKEIDNYISNNFFGSQTMGFFANRTKEEPNDEDIAIVAKHFFELGLKAQHDN